MDLPDDSHIHSHRSQKIFYRCYTRSEASIENINWRDLVVVMVDGGSLSRTIRGRILVWECRLSSRYSINVKHLSTKELYTQL